RMNPTAESAVTKSAEDQSHHSRFLSRCRSDSVCCARIPPCPSNDRGDDCGGRRLVSELMLGGSLVRCGHFRPTGRPRAMQKEYRAIFLRPPGRWDGLAGQKFTVDGRKGEAEGQQIPCTQNRRVQGTPAH